MPLLLLMNLQTLLSIVSHLPFYVVIIAILYFCTIL